MDEKTLEYMGSRVDEARAITKRIGEIQTQIDRINGGTTMSVTVHGPYGCVAHLLDADGPLEKSEGYKQLVLEMLLSAIRELRMRLERL